MHGYTDLDLFPTIVQIIDDSDAPNATNFDTPVEGVLNRTFWLRNRLQVMKSNAFTNGSTWTAPASGTISICILEGNGGGGGGGGGTSSSTSASTLFPGGGGGGGALRYMRTFTAVAGHVYTATIGAGGAGGVGSATPTAGGDGGDTILTDTTASVEVARFRGGQGGQAGGVFGDTVDIICPGGASVAGGAPIGSFTDALGSNVWRILGISESFGGMAGDRIVPAAAGQPSRYGALGGALGAPGANAGGSLHGGGGGGGGGAGWNRAGGAGGSGGDGANPGTGAVGTQGLPTVSPLSGSGAGGGGGGGAGAGTIAGNAGQYGGLGDTGSLTIYWIETGTQ